MTLNSINEAERERIIKWVTNHYSVRINPITLIGGRNKNAWSISCTYDKRYSFPIENNTNLEGTSETALSVEQVKTAIFKMIDEIVTNVEKKIVEETNKENRNNGSDL